MDSTWIDRGCKGKIGGGGEKKRISALKREIIAMTLEGAI